MSLLILKIIVFWVRNMNHSKKAFLFVDFSYLTISYTSQFLLITFIFYCKSFLYKQIDANSSNKYIYIYFTLTYC